MIDSHQKSLRELKFDCVVCSDSDSGMVTVFVDGISKGARKCECRVRRSIERGLALVPQEFGAPKLMELKPRQDLHPAQATAIAYMKEHPEESYLLCGDNGTGKTFLGYALYLHALFAGRRVVAMTVQELLSQYKRMEMHEAGPKGEAFRAAVVVDDLRQNHTRFTLFLDEFEKARATEFTCEMLYALIDAAYAFGHQLIVTSNMNVNSLINRWGRIDEVYGRSIGRRLASMCSGVGFFFEEMNDSKPF